VKFDRSSVFVGACLALSACATMPRLYSGQEIAAVGRACGLAAGELIQEEEEPRLVFLFKQGPSRTQVNCVKGWTRKHRLTLALVDMKWADDAAAH